MNLSPDPLAPPAYTRSSVVAYLRAAEAERQRIVRAIAEAHHRTETARRLAGRPPGPDAGNMAPAPGGSPFPVPSLQWTPPGPGPVPAAVAPAPGDAGLLTPAAPEDPVAPVTPDLGRLLLAPQPSSTDDEARWHEAARVARVEQTFRASQAAHAVAMARD